MKLAGRYAMVASLLLSACAGRRQLEAHSAALEDPRLKSLVADYLSTRASRDAMAKSSAHEGLSPAESAVSRQNLLGHEAKLATIRDEIVDHVVRFVTDGGRSSGNGSGARIGSDGTAGTR
jgi:hypothetical protein